MKIKTGRNLGLTKNQCIELMHETVYQYRKAGNDLYEKGYYRRTTPQIGNYYGQPRTATIYFLTESGNLETRRWLFLATFR